MVKGNVAVEVCVPEVPVMVSSVVPGAAVLLAYWLILFWMDRRKIYLKV